MKRLLVLCLGLVGAAPVTAAPVTKNVPLENSSPHYILEKLQPGLGKLPSGLTITRDDAKAELVVTGEAKDIARFEELVSELDKPIRTVQLEGVITTVNPVELKVFGLSSAANTPGNALASSTNPQASIAILRWGELPTRKVEEVPAGQYQPWQPAPPPLVPLAARTFSPTLLPVAYKATLDALVATQHAKIISGFQMRTNPILKSSIVTTTTTPVGSGLMYASSNGVIATSSVDTNEKISVVIEPMGHVGAASANSVGASSTFLTAPGNKTNIILNNLQDGDTVALAGVMARRFYGGREVIENNQDMEQLFKTDGVPTPYQEMVVFITVRTNSRGGNNVPAHVALR
jgi:hypothetical protein